MSKFMAVWKGRTPRDYSTNIALRHRDELDKILTVTAYLVDCETNRVLYEEDLEFSGLVDEEEAKRLVIEWLQTTIEKMKRP